MQTSVKKYGKKRKLNKKSYLKTSDISKYTVPLKLVEERPRSKIKYGKKANSK